MNELHRRLMRTFRWWRTGVLVAALWAPLGHASVAIYVGKNLTKSGNVLLAGFGDEPSSHWLSIVPRREHPPAPPRCVAHPPPGGASYGRAPSADQ